jgi:UDP-N-acetylmuramyl-tripeptide synthetase
VHLLELVADSNKWAILNRGDASFNYLKPKVKSSLMTFAVEDPAADVTLSDSRLSAEGSWFTLETPIGKEKVHIELLGRFNLENSLCAAACALALGIPLDQVAAGLEAPDYIPGRAQPVRVNQPFDVLIDYAHSPDALEKILQTARELCRGKLLVVFGCGGDRDRGKRPLMGKVASENADVVVVTSDNPRSEDPLAIIAEIKPGLLPSTKVIVEPDRYKGISAALDLCEDDDLLVVAGKGHENYQIIGNQQFRFDDREIVEKILRERYK